jgi:hypothetical protein
VKIGGVGCKKRSQDRPGIDQVAEDVRRQPEPVDDLARPKAALCLQQSGRGGHRPLVGHSPAEPEAQQVWNEGYAVGGFESGPPLLGQHLIHRVDLHRPDARDLVCAAHRQTSGGTLDHALGAPVAVMEGGSEQCHALVQQPVVHTPRIDSDAVNTTGLPRQADARKALPVEFMDIPVQPVGQLVGPVGEPADLLDPDSTAPEPPHDDSPGLGAQVDCDQCHVSVHIQPLQPASG